MATVVHHRRKPVLQRLRPLFIPPYPPPDADDRKDGTNADLALYVNRLAAAHAGYWTVEASLQKNTEKANRSLTAFAIQKSASFLANSRSSVVCRWSSEAREKSATEKKKESILRWPTFLCWGLSAVINVTATTAATTATMPVTYQPSKLHGHAHQGLSNNSRPKANLSRLKSCTS